MDQKLRDMDRPTRNAVQGEAHADDATKDGDSFIRPLEELLNEYCWGTVWGREESPRKARNMISIAMTSVMNRPQELRGHLLVGLNNGITRDKMREILVQVALYHGTPSAFDSIRIAREVFAELDNAESSNT